MSIHAEPTFVRAEIERRYELAGYAPGSSHRREWLRGVTSTFLVRARRDASSA